MLFKKNITVFLPGNIICTVIKLTHFITLSCCCIDKMRCMHHAVFFFYKDVQNLYLASSRKFVNVHAIDGPTNLTLYIEKWGKRGILFSFV